MRSTSVLLTLIVGFGLVACSANSGTNEPLGSSTSHLDGDDDDGSVQTAGGGDDDDDSVGDDDDDKVGDDDDKSGGKTADDECTEKNEFCGGS